MNESLMQIVVDMIEFFANCDDSVLDPDVSVAKLEEIAFLVQQMPDKERELFVKFTQQAAKKIKKDDKHRSEFYRSIPENLGLC
ncbi:MAG: hypothetical protein KDB00_00530 [Planctomycetales bacterium]|nr:hypothetical protein [Planctomycetales bacterium]